MGVVTVRAPASRLPCVRPFRAASPLLLPRANSLSIHGRAKDLQKQEAAGGSASAGQGAPMQALTSASPAAEGNKATQ